MFSRYFPSEATATLKTLGQIRRNRVIMVTVPALLTFLIPAFTTDTAWRWQMDQRLASPTTIRLTIG
jgi:hypothetical protein